MSAHTHPWHCDQGKQFLFPTLVPGPSHPRMWPQHHAMFRLKVAVPSRTCLFILSHIKVQKAPRVQPSS